MITENVQVFWAELQRGEFITDAAVAAGTYRKQATRWVIANGGVRPRRGRDLKGRCLSFAERERIAMFRACQGLVDAGDRDRAGSKPVDGQPGVAPQRCVRWWLSGQCGARDGL